MIIKISIITCNELFIKPIPHIISTIDYFIKNLNDCCNKDNEEYNAFFYKIADNNQNLRNLLATILNNKKSLGLSVDLAKAIDCLNKDLLTVLQNNAYNLNNNDDDEENTDY